MLCLFVCLAVLAGYPGLGQDAPTISAHKEQTEMLANLPPQISEDTLEIQDLEQKGILFPKSKPGARASHSAISNDFIVFGYLQNSDIVYNVRWHTLTHIGSLFVNFDHNGNLTNKTTAWDNRSPYLKAGGAAQAAGVKVIMVVNNFDDAPGGDIEQVMTTPAKRTTLVNEIVSAVTGDAYCGGVSMDLEFSWGATVRDGVTAFFQELRTALPPPYEISVYTNAILHLEQWDFNAETGITPHIDYMIYSMYNWASGNTAHAISDFDNCLMGATHIQGYLNEGLPPEKMVLAISVYSKRWNGITSYNQTGSSASSGGFTDGLYDITLNLNYGGPYTHNYVTGDECAWYTWNDGTNRVRTWEGLEGIEYKIRHVLSCQDPNGVWNGRRFRGIAYWSLYWMAELSSYDPRTDSSVTRTRTYPHVYQIAQEALAAPGVKTFLIDGFEGLDPRWCDPNDAPDTTGDLDGDSARSLVPAPAGAGRPDSTTNAMQVTFDFENSSGNKLVFAHEVLNSPLATGVTDLNAVAGVFDANTKLSAYIHTPASYFMGTIRLIAIDKERDLEMSDPYTLAATGWRKIEWDLTDITQTHAFIHSEPNFNLGDNMIHTAGGGKKDIGFFGFLIDGGEVAMTGTVTIDELSYEHANPGGKSYVINEFRYENADTEFVEIFGPQGLFPPNTQLRFFSAYDASVMKTFALSGYIPNDTGTGYGYFVIGDSGVPNVNSTEGFDIGFRDLPDWDPSAMQIYNADTGCVYDSVVYEAFGGLDNLIRKETLGVTGEGYPWLGRIGSGSNASGVDYTQGRYPDGFDTNVNNNDFSFMPASPGASNGNSLSLPAHFDFTTTPGAPFQTFQDFTIADPAIAGLPPSSNGGNAYRCVNTTGGGVMGVFGDKGLGWGSGYRATGEIYIPPSTDPVQALGLGIAGNHGSSFFSPARSENSYEDGYWLIYENASGASLDDGRPDHPEIFEFVMASHDNMDGSPVTLIASKTLVNLGITAGTWVPFDMMIDPDTEITSQSLIVRINSETVYQGGIPPGGRTSGAFVVGFRENHPDVPSAREGTWIDNLRLADPDATPTPTVKDYIDYLLERTLNVPPDLNSDAGIDAADLIFLLLME
jgi:hypothetical protein